MLNIYLLTKKPLEVPADLHSLGAVYRIPVQGNNWYTARERAFKMAEDAGDTRACIVCDGVSILRRHTSMSEARPAGPNDYHGLWLYLRRLTASFGHVYVAPSFWARRMPRSGAVLSPTIPLVSVYQVKALQEVRHSWDDPSLGVALCAAGYHSYTVGDYFYQVEGDPRKKLLDDAGSADQWLSAYVAAVNTLLE